MFIYYFHMNITKVILHFVYFWLYGHSYEPCRFIQQIISIPHIVERMSDIFHH